MLIAPTHGRLEYGDRDSLKVTDGGWTAAAQGLGSGSAWVGRRYALSDLPALLWRERRLMLAVFLTLSVLGMAAALTLKTRYEAYSSVLVRLGHSSPMNSAD